MKAKKKWKRLRELAKECEQINKCDGCKYEEGCKSMLLFTGANFYTLLKIINFLKGFNKV